MRSPPMTLASLHLDDERVSAEAYTRVTSASSRALPQHVADEIKRVDLKDLYWTVQDNRNRRLRLLICRYFNQIQYGCHNRNCTTPTCLSFRNRNTKGPLRRYTDLSARALAGHLVEEYSNAGKDPDSALCQNHPVVPWYQDPVSRRHSKKSLGLGSQQANGTLPQPKNGRSSTKIDSAGGRASLRSTLYDDSPSQTSKQTERKSSIDETAENGIQNKIEQNDEGEAIQEHFVPQEETEIVQPAKKKDLSSFVQSLWDTLSLRKLQPTNTPTPSPSSQVVAPESTPDLELPAFDHRAPSSEAESELDLQEPRPGLELSNTAFFGFSLKRLSWKTLTWLVDVRNKNPDLRSTSFEIFLRQSLHHCLSSPDRLYDSAQHWSDDTVSHTSTSENYRLDEESQEAYKKHLKQSGTDNHKTSRPAQPSFNINRSLEAFDMLATLSDGTDPIYSALHAALQKCYTVGLPRPSSMQQQRALKSLKRSGGGMRSVGVIAEPATQQAMNKHQVAEVFLLMLMATLMPLFSEDFADAGLDPIILGSTADMKNNNLAYPFVVDGLAVKERDSRLRQLLIDVIDHFEDWHLLRLTTSLMNCLSHHLAATAIRRNQKASILSDKAPRNILELLLDRLCEALPAVESGAEIEFRAIAGLGTIELARSVLLKEWDREPVIRRTSSVGGALEFLAAVYRKNRAFFVGHTMFYMPFLAQALDEMEMPVQWLSFHPNGRETHILAFSFLFEPATLVKYFRSINVNSMRRAHESASTYHSDARQFLSSTAIPVYGGKEVLGALRPHMAKYLVLTIRRSNILEDAIDQLWRRQRREIMRPLRVRLGKDEGEDGLDHGGVQQEFFRLVFAEAFEPKYGMFTVDSSTHMTWFQPGSLEPLYKFEALGILMSLAVYNAITLPITFPLAFYRKLLGLKVKNLDQINDGWPDLSRGLQTLLDYEGDVAEVISRTYEFSYAFSGSTVSIDMQKHGRDDPWPPIERPSRKGKEKAKSASFELPVQLDITPPSQSPPTGPLSHASSLKGISTPLSLESETLDDDAATVTNETREQYVKDYVFWLTDKSIRPQFEAFTRGFFTCLDPTALSMFNPEALRQVIEGHRSINIDELERTTSYEEYDKSSHYMRQFWSVVRDLSPAQHRQLLEFVTASDRVPVNGLESIQFIVQKNGDDDVRLPSSSTCYGRLLLPQYSTKEILVEKLTKALENSLGFGAL